MAKRKTKYIKVQTTRYYAVDMLDKTRTKINGWTEKEVLDEWFGTKYMMDQHHVTREGHFIGNTDVVDNAKFVTEKEFEKDMDIKIAKITKEREEREAERKRIEDEHQAELTQYFREQKIL